MAWLDVLAEKALNQPGAADLAMIADAGFAVEGAEDAKGELAATLASPVAAPSASRPDIVHLRRCGSGTVLPAST